MERRELLKATSLLAVAAGLPAISIADPKQKMPSLNNAGTGHFKFTCGNLKMMMVTDGHILIKPTQPIIAPGIPKDQVVSALDTDFVPNDEVDAAINVLVIFKDERVILIDTGSGLALGVNSGHLVNNLAAAGVHPDLVTDILITHLHIDHIGGLTDKAGKLIFKNASYYLSKVEHDFWMSSNPDFSKSKNTVSPQENIEHARHAISAIKSKLNLFDFGTSLFDCIKVESAKGHTPGHPLLTIFSGQYEVKHMVDIVHTSLLLTHPEWGTQWDIDFDTALDTRRNILNRLASSRQTVISCHLPWPGIGHIIHNSNGGYDWKPMAFSIPQLYETLT